jgi:hypothetical protein
MAGPLEVSDGQTHGAVALLSGDLDLGGPGNRKVNVQAELASRRPGMAQLESGLRDQ